MTQVIKNNPDYTDKVGKEFDIMGAEIHHDTDNAKPVLKTKKVPHGWEFSFGLEGYYSGVNIYRKRPDEENFSYLATDTAALMSITSKWKTAPSITPTSSLAIPKLGNKVMWLLWGCKVMED